MGHSSTISCVLQVQRVVRVAINCFVEGEVEDLGTQFGDI